MKTNTDIIIVGGGIIGTSCAYHLARAGLQVTLVEKAQLGCGTSARNFFWANASTKTTDAAYHHLNAHSVQLYQSFADTYGADTLGIHGLGALGVVRRSDAPLYTASRQKSARLTALGYPNQWLDSAELRAAEPDFLFPDDAEALLTPSDKIIHGQRMIRFFATQIHAMGGQILENCAATEICLGDEGNITGLRTQNGEISAPKLLLATGPDTAQVLADLTGFDGYSRFPINQVPGLLLITPPLPMPRPAHIVYADSTGGLQFQPDVGGGLRVGSDDTDGLILNDQSPQNLRKQGRELLRRVQSFIPEFAGESLIEQCRLDIGIRPYPEDGKTIAGALPGAEGLFLVATHSGITLAPAIGSLMAQTITTGTAPDLLAPFGLHRLAGFG